MAEFMHRYAPQTVVFCPSANGHPYSGMIPNFATASARYVYVRGHLHGHLHGHVYKHKPTHMSKCRYVHVCVCEPRRCSSGGLLACGLFW